MTIKEFVAWFIGASYAAPPGHREFCQGIRHMEQSGYEASQIAYAINGYFEVKAHLQEFFLKTVNVPPAEEPVTKTFIELLRENEEKRQEYESLSDLLNKAPFEWPKNKYVLVC